jgi:hypothetical protein
MYLQLHYQSKTPLNNEQSLNNEEQECKTGHNYLRVLIRGGGQTKKVKGGKFYQYIFYTCMNMDIETC